MRHEVGTDASGYPELFDCTAAKLNLTATHIKMLAEFRKTIAESHPPGPVAIVAKPEVYLGVFRMFDGLTKGVRPLEVFLTSSNAESWLDSLEGYCPAAA